MRKSRQLARLFFLGHGFECYSVLKNVRTKKAASKAAFLYDMIFKNVLLVL